MSEEAHARRLVTLRENRIGRHDTNNTAWHRLQPLRHHRSRSRIRILFGLDRREDTTDGAKHCRPTAVRKTFNATAAANAAAAATVAESLWEVAEEAVAGWLNSRLVATCISLASVKMCEGVVGRWLISRGWELGYTKKLRPLEVSKEQSLAAPSDLHSAICHTPPTRALTPYSNAAMLTSQQPLIAHCLTPKVLRPSWI